MNTLKAPKTMLLAAGLLAMTGAAWADPGHDHGRGRGPHHGPGHHHDRYVVREVYRPRPVIREYRYVYYPEHNVYFAPHERVWYVRNDYRWQPYYSAPRRLYGGVDVVLHVPLR